MEAVKELIEKLIPIRKAILEVEHDFEEIINGTHPNYKYSVLNFLRYLRLRTFDLRKIQGKLTIMGLSSISHSERHVLANIENILYLLHLLISEHFEGKFKFGEHPVNFVESRRVLNRNAKRLFKNGDKLSYTYIMVTLPATAVDYKQVLELVQSGMEIARINCAHDSQMQWLEMVKNIRRAERETGKSCAVYFDLAGPKLRTGPLKSIKIKKGKKIQDFIFLNKGETVCLLKEQVPGKIEKRRKSGQVKSPGCISISLPEVFDWVRQGQRILFDDGNITGEILSVEEGLMDIKITRCNPKGSKLKAEKGINMPDTQMELDSLTDEDLENLPFIVEHADIVGYSFVRTAQDVSKLQKLLFELGGQNLGIILKIENREAFENLPSLLVQAMKSPSIGIMTARGDLAVEMGAERLSEVQEEIMWLCEAALIPNIWATQVLETLAKKGVVTRAEITDAAMAGRAECVMLNKGEYIVEAVRTLVDITERMGHHQMKKQGTMRKLKVVDKFFQQLSKNEMEIG